MFRLFALCRKRMLLRKQNRRFAFVARAQHFFEPALLGYANRLCVLRMNDANSPPQHRVGPLDILVAPSERCAGGFRGIALPVHTRGEHPSYFGHAFQRRLDLPLPVRKSHLSRETAGFLFLHEPITKPLPRPMADSPQCSSPGVLLRQRLPTNVARHYRIGPHRRAIGKVLRPMPAQTQPLCLNHRHFHAARTKSSHAAPHPKMLRTLHPVPYVIALRTGRYKFPKGAISYSLLLALL